METKFTKPSFITVRAYIAIAILLSVFSSCTTFKNIPYFQDLTRAQPTTDDITNYTTLTIQPLDQLSINVSSLNPDASAVFNNNTQNSGTTPDNTNFGYTVNEKGEVKFPLIGIMKVSGLTTEQLSSQMQQRLLTFLREPIVSVNVLNFKVAVLGDVMRPNIYVSPSERLTIPEALSLAGDLNITANRKDILLVREKDGKRQFIPLDLTSKELFNSPYFYLKGNDLLFVQPTKLKLANVDTGYRNVSLIISALSLLAITYQILR